VIGPTYLGAATSVTIWPVKLLKVAGVVVSTVVATSCAASGLTVNILIRTVLIRVRASNSLTPASIERIGSLDAAVARRRRTVSEANGELADRKDAARAVS
jgi:hypothetical protein